MRQSASKRKKLDYPHETEGSRLAAKLRKLASKLTPEERGGAFSARYGKDLLSSTQLSIAIRFATRLIDSSLIPETEQNDGKILAQTSLAKIPLLVTSDKHLLDVDEYALLLAFNDADLLPVHPSHPKRLLKALR
jgi:hypothetical protein